MTDKKTYVLIVSEKFPVHHFRKGEPTNFISGILNNKKLHTIRNNYPLWKKRIDEVNRRKAIISLRVWNGKPYKDKQIEIMKITGLGIQLIDFTDQGVAVDGLTFPHIEEIAQNDGLTLKELESWFKGTPSGEYALIQFTKFRY